MISEFPQPPRLPRPLRITEQAWPEGTVPVVSVLCITYNHEKFIRDAIEGFLMQETTFPVEIFVHDDASTDRTADIVKEYAEKYPQLFWTVFQTENQWSKGNRKIFFEYLAKQRGEFIALCEGDDYWISPNKLQKQVEMLQMESSASLCFHNALVKTDSGETPRLFHESLEKDYYSLDDVLFTAWYVPTGSIMIRGKHARVSDTLSFCQSGDMCLLISAALRGQHVYWGEVASAYRKHSGGVSQGHTGEAYFTGLMPNWFWMFEAFRVEAGSDQVVAETFLRASDCSLSRFSRHLASAHEVCSDALEVRRFQKMVSDLIYSSCPEVMSNRAGDANFRQEVAARVLAVSSDAFAFASRHAAEHLELSRSLKITGAALRQGLIGPWQGGREVASNFAYYLFRVGKVGLQSLAHGK